MPEFDFIVAGQGIAGTTMALELHSRGKKVLVIDDGHKTAASKVAAGMWNPVIFRKLTRSWKVDALLPAMLSFYRYWEQAWDIRLLHERPLLRILDAPDQYNDWLAKSGDPFYRPYLSDETTTDLKGLRLKFSGGYGLVKGAGFLDVPLYLAWARYFLKANDLLFEETVQYTDVIPGADEVSYKEYKASALIFCEGAQGRNNPWFRHLPFAPTKGETIDIHSGGLPEKTIANGGVWVIPLGKEKYKVGATFEWEDLSQEITSRAKEKLERELQQMITPAYSVIAQQAGVRPTTRDRRPFAGSSSKASAIKIFNGLGTKGVMIAPWLAGHFADHLLLGSPLDAEVDIKRF